MVWVTGDGCDRRVRQQAVVQTLPRGFCRHSGWLRAREENEETGACERQQRCDKNGKAKPACDHADNVT